MSTYQDGIDKAIKIVEKHKHIHHIVEVILRELKQAKKNEQGKIPY